VEAPILTKHYFGNRNLGMTIGVISVFINLGFAAGPPLLGYFADINGNFTLGIMVYVGLALLGTLLLVPVKPRYWIPPSKRKPAGEEVVLTTGGPRPASAH